jgi:hypothetical protein
MIQQDIAVQLTAATLYTLATWHGWGKVRLKRFVGELNSTFEDMNGAGFAGKFDTGDLEQLVLEKYGIDLDKEIEVVSKKGGRK